MKFVPVAIGFGLSIIAALGPLEAQQYVMSTVAGGASPPTPMRGVDLSVTNVTGVATDAAGNVYFTGDNCAFRLDPNGILTRIAGNYAAGYAGDGGSATSALMNGPQSLAVDGTGNIFIVDSGNNRVRRVAPSGVIATVAGNGTSGFSGDGGPAISAQLSGPAGVAVDGAGNLFIADTGNIRVRKVSPGGIITTVAGDGTSGFSGDGGPATRTQLNGPTGVALDGVGDLFIADSGNIRVRKVTPSGIITTVAGVGTSGFSGDGGQATSAQLYGPTNVAVDGAGNLFVADTYFQPAVYNPDTGDFDGCGCHLYSLTREVSSSGIITTVAGTGTYGFSGDGGPATRAQLNGPDGVAVDGAGNLFIADTVNGRIREVWPSGIITTVAGNGAQPPFFSGDGGFATSAQLAGPTGVAGDGAGSLFIAEQSGGRVRKVSPSGIITTVAGNGTSGFSGDGGPAINAQLNQPEGVASDGVGNLFIADTFDLRVRKVSAGGIISTVAGSGAFDYGASADGGLATSVPLSQVTAMAVDGSGNLFLAETLGYRVRKVSLAGIITTVAGGYGADPVADGAPATSGRLSGVEGLAVDSSGNLFIAELFGNRVRKVSPNGIITTVAGNGTPGYSGDGGPAISAQLNEPFSIAVDGSGKLFIADVGNHCVRVVSADGIITSAVGHPMVSFGGFSGAASLAPNAPPFFQFDVAVDGAGNVYVAEKGNNVVRLLRPTSRQVFIDAVVDAASQSASPISPGKIVVIYGAGLGPVQLIQNQPGNGQFGTTVGGTSVTFNGVSAPILYASATQVATLVPYANSGTTAQVSVTYQGQTSAAFSVPVAPSAPGLFTSNESGSGQASAINADGTVNSAANPAKIGDSITLYATGEGQTSPAGVDGKLGGSAPVLPVKVTIGGIPAVVQSKGGVPGQVAGLMQVNVQVPSGLQPGGYVDVVLQVGDASTTSGAVWIAVSGS